MVAEPWRTDPHPWRFWYRESPRCLVPENPYSETTTIRPNDPPMEISGMVSIAMDARGNLERLRAVPPQVETQGALGGAAGLEAAFRRRGARRRAVLTVRRRGGCRRSRSMRARTGMDRIATRPDMPIHVAAASWQGRPVSVRGDLSLERSGAGDRDVAVLAVFGDIAFVIYIGGAWIAGIVLARRNLRLGRGDRRGALRVAAFVFATGVLAWLFAWHHVPQATTEFFQLINAVAVSLFLAVIRLARVRRDRADRAETCPRAAVLLEPCPRRTVPRSPRRPGSARRDSRQRGDGC